MAKYDNDYDNFLVEYNDFLSNFIKNCKKCQNCCHGWDEGCFFASVCLINQFSYYKEK